MAAKPESGKGAKPEIISPVYQSFVRHEASTKIIGTINAMFEGLCDTSPPHWVPSFLTAYKTELEKQYAAENALFLEELAKLVQEYRKWECATPRPPARPAAPGARPIPPPPGGRARCARYAPPPATHREDIAPNLVTMQQHLYDKFVAEKSEHHANIDGKTARALRRLRGHDWPLVDPRASAWEAAKDNVIGASWALMLNEDAFGVWLRTKEGTHYATIVRREELREERTKKKEASAGETTAHFEYNNDYYEQQDIGYHEAYHPSRDFMWDSNHIGNDMQYGNDFTSTKVHYDHSIEYLAGFLGLGLVVLMCFCMMLICVGIIGYMFNVVKQQRARLRRTKESFCDDHEV